MILAKKLIELLKQVPGDSKVSAYEGEDVGFNIQLPDFSRLGDRLWIRACDYSEVDDYIDGFDLLNSDKIKCDQCEANMINGVFCHETGCPNSKKKWIEGEWRAVFKCDRCGWDFYEDEQCCQED